MTKSKHPSEREILAAYESGHLQSVKRTASALKRFKESARGTFIKDRRVNIRLSSPDLMDIQARAAEEGVPYQTLMSSVLHKFVSGQFVAKLRASHERRTDSEATYDLNERRD
jgi:predicted DNA binding CopG/RHH family protein